MPVVISPQHDELYERLVRSGAVVLREDDAVHQDIRPARIGLLNLMPAATMEVTENQWLRYISNTVLQIEPVLLKFDNDTRERNGASRKEILKRYTSFSEGSADGLDALIVTGDNLELRKLDDTQTPQALPFEEITYGPALKEIIDWAREHVFSTIYSCLASHFALNHLHGIERTIANEKVFGVFEHEVTKYTRSPITQGMDDVLSAPHARWGDMASSDLTEADVQVLADNRETGWLLASDENNNGGLDLYMQGHPEYDKYDLHGEFLRDWENGQRMPLGYYDSNNPAALPRMTWANDARALHANWISTLYKHFSGNSSS
ncbi:MAG TPA: homoserine O-succinyltransferase [Acidimicrobiia bacterium]|nr:homoserine O-succinyltransferase [Acidimicrobiia bacterium]